MTHDQDNKPSPARKGRSWWQRPDHVLRQTNDHLMLQRGIQQACSPKEPKLDAPGTGFEK